MTAGDSSESDLDVAIRLAAEARQWDAVKALAELQTARERAASGVLDLGAARKAKAR